MTKVLLVDDNDRQRKLSRLYLEDAGYTVEDASNALDALDAARAAPPDVIVSDVMMDAVDGFNLCRRVRADTRLAPIPVVLVSAHYDDHAARELATTLGAYALIQRTPDFSAEMAGISACMNSTVSAPKRSRRDAFEAHLEANAKQLARLLDETRRAERRWRTLFDHALDAVTLITPDGVIVEANQRWESLLGVPVCDLIGRHISEFMAPETVQENADIFQAGLEHEVSHARVTLRHASGAPVYLDFSVNVIAVDGTDHLMTIGRNVTERVLAERRQAQEEAARKKLQEHLAHAQRLETIGQMTGSIAHDFNNILSAIMLNAETMLEELAVGDPRRDEAEEIHLSVRRAAALTKHLLAFSRKQVLEIVELDVSSVVESMTRMVRRLLGGAIEIRVSDTTAHAKIRADLVQLEQVIVNLAVNARDAMQPTGGVLTITTSEATLACGGGAERPCVLLAITDTGCGMSEETKAHLFEPFFTTKQRGHGTGLGLSTSFGIVKQLGGEIVVDSELGRGTTMNVYLPRV